MTIHVSNLLVDRNPINQQTFQMATYLATHGWPDSWGRVKVQALGNGNYKVKNGRHRVTAARLVGVEYIPCK